MGHLVLKAVALAGVRAVVATGWGGIEPGERLPDTVLAIDQAPHDWLLPRMSVVVHHAGGTTWTAVAAGRPQVVCPSIGDQPFWARRMHALGVAPPPLPAARLTPEDLAAAIRTAGADRGMRERAATLADRIKAEDGAAAAVTVLEKVHAGR
jgi:sterol 3beta-glucosyltransferase